MPSAAARARRPSIRRFLFSMSVLILTVRAAIAKPMEYRNGGYALARAHVARVYAVRRTRKTRFSIRIHESTAHGARENEPRFVVHHVWTMGEK